MLLMFGMQPGQNASSDASCDRTGKRRILIPLMMGKPYWARAFTSRRLLGDVGSGKRKFLHAYDTGRSELLNFALSTANLPVPWPLGTDSSQKTFIPGGVVVDPETLNFLVVETTEASNLCQKHEVHHEGVSHADRGAIFGQDVKN